MAIQPVATRPVGLKGHYGFLTDYRNMSFNEVVARVNTMVQLGIREFQFYDWFCGYSTPIPTQGQTWRDPFLQEREISLDTIRNFTRVIRERGGRSWAYVQMVGASEANLENLQERIFKLITKNGQQHVHAEKIYCYFPNTAWAQRMVRVWAQTIKDLGFDGIHWDTLGSHAGNYGDETAGIHEFLKYTHQELLQNYCLRQTANFVDLAWWDDTIVCNFVEFPYAEVWSLEKKSEYYSNIRRVFSDAHTGKRLVGVVAHYTREGGDRVAALFNEALMHRCSYLFFGDGGKCLMGEYFPSARDASQEKLWLLFKQTLLDGNRLALKTSNGTHYLCAQEGGGGVVHAQYPENERWQEFKVNFCGGRWVSLLARDGRHFLSAQGGGGIEVNAKLTDEGEQQKFEISFLNPRHITLKSIHNTYLSATHGGRGEVRTQAVAGQREQFSYEISLPK